MCIVDMNTVLADYKTLPDAGNYLYSRIKKAIEEGDKVSVNMNEVTSLPSIFLNVSLGKIIDEFGKEELKKHVGFTKITKQQALRLKDYLLRYE